MAKEIKGKIEYSIRFDDDGVAFKIDNCTPQNINEQYFIALSLILKEIIQILESPLRAAMPQEIEEQMKDALTVLDDLRTVKVRKLKKDNGINDKSVEFLNAISDMLKEKLGIKGDNIEAFEISKDGVEKVDLNDLAQKIKDHMNKEKNETSSKDEDAGEKPKDEDTDELTI